MDSRAIALRIGLVVWVGLSAVATAAQATDGDAVFDEQYRELVQLQANGQLGRSADLLRVLARAPLEPEQRALLSVADVNQALLTRQWNHAEASLTSARAAVAEPKPTLAVALDSAQGNLLLLRGDAAGAVTYFESAVGAARLSGVAELVAETQVNLARAAARAQLQSAPLHWTEAFAAVAALPESIERASLDLSLGTFAPARRDNYDALMRAHATADAVRWVRGQSLALGLLAAVYFDNEQLDESLACASRAAFFAQQAPELLYRWHWQAARVHAARREQDAAIAAYQQAAAALAPIRATVAIGHGNQFSISPLGVSSFRTAVGELYREWARQHLERAAAGGGEADLRSARDALEELKAAELEDYFQTDCATLVRDDLSEVESLLEPRTAVVYVAAFDDKTELIVSLNRDGRPALERFSSQTGRARLMSDVAQFRSELEDRTSHAYKRSGQRIYETLIAPLEPTLKAYDIDTLVFVPDEALRTVPMSALWDGNDFLIARYAVAVVPGLRLMRGEASAARPNVLAIGSTQRMTIDGGAEVYAALEAVQEELAGVQATYGGRQLLDRQATPDALTRVVDEGRYNIVHIASHGEFRDESADTFILLGDTASPQKLSLEQLSSLILPNQYRGAPVQLLTLSACRSAAGDDRAALGLGGVALKAGARSSVATLWYVNDRVSATLMQQFYAQLSSQPQRGLARALQAAQLSVLRSETDRRYRHPCYWSPYLLIGNWK